jgi:error-prone DNA polymerase
VRPGPISGGMVHPYLRRRRGEEAVTFPHPCLEAVLAKTLGVPLFQEQVMRLAMVAADYTPGEADQLRRDMAAWRRSGKIEGHHDRLVSRMVQKGIARDFAERVFEQIRGFGEYGFPESHAASFALIAYATAWLRCHYPAEFVCSLLNAQPMGFYSPATIVSDAQRHGVDVLPIDVNASSWHSTLEDSGSVRLGLRWISGLSLKEGAQIAEARAMAPFESVADFVCRAQISTRSLATLSQGGALSSLQAERRDALWQVLGWAKRAKDTLDLGGQTPVDGAHFAPLSWSQEINWNYQAANLSTSGHLLAPWRQQLTVARIPSAQQIGKAKHGARVRYVGVVICRQRPATASGVTFLTLEDESGFVNVVVWKQVFAAHAVVLRTCTLLGVAGRLEVQEGIVHLIADEVWEPQLAAQLATTASRDFH